MNSIFLEDLDWDSNFFQFKVGKVIIDNSNFNLDEITNQMSLRDIRLTYMFSKVKLAIDNHKLNGFESRLADNKITYTKSTKNNSIIQTNNGIEFISVNQNYKSEELKSMAIQSGIYSRFNLDPKFSRDAFEQLYIRWINKSVNRKIAMEVFIAQYNSKPIGLITLGEKDNNADIGLVSVDQNYRGKKIATNLLKKAEDWAYNKGYSTIQVITQKDNIPACQLYEKFGFSINKQEYIYHLWKI